jgi:hypothetical protein
MSNVRNQIKAAFLVSAADRMDICVADSLHARVSYRHIHSRYRLFCSSMLAYWFLLDQVKAVLNKSGNLHSGSDLRLAKYNLVT